MRNAIIGVVLRKAEELGQLAASLQRVNRELETFLYSVAHDPGAPFRHIFGFAEMLHKRIGPSLDETGRRYTGKIIEAASYAGSLVDSLPAGGEFIRREAGGIRGRHGRDRQAGAVLGGDQPAAAGFDRDGEIEAGSPRGYTWRGSRGGRAFTAPRRR